LQRKSITCRADNWVGDDNWVSHPSGRQPNFAALNRGRHLCSAGRPSGWALAHILVYIYASQYKIAIIVKLSYLRSFSIFGVNKSNFYEAQIVAKYHAVQLHTSLSELEMTDS